MIPEPENILEVDKLITSFETDRGLLRAVDQVSFTVPAGKTVGIVGESGCGKSVTAMSIIRLLPQPAGKILGGHVYFKGRDLVRASDAEIQRDPRRRDRRDFPGTHGRAQPGAPHRPPGRGGLPPAQEALENGRLGRRHRDAADSSASPRRRSA